MPTLTAECSMCYILYVGNDHRITENSNDIIQCKIGSGLFSKFTPREIIKNINYDSKKYRPEAILIDESYIAQNNWILNEVRKFYDGPIIVIVKKVDGSGPKYVGEGATDYILDIMYKQDIISKIVERSKASISFDKHAQEVKDAVTLNK